MSATEGRGPLMRILIVDDSVDTARMMRVLLKQAGHEVRTAFDGEEAVGVAAEFTPQVVLLDLTLPGMTGREVALKLRNDPATAGALIVAVSGFGDEGVPPGFDHLMIKPVNHEALKALLATHAASQGQPKVYCHGEPS